MKDESKKVAKKEESSDESSADNKYEQPAKKAASAKKATPEHKNAVRKESSNEDSSEDEKPDKEATPARTAAPTMASTKEESSDDACGACGCSTPGSTPNKTKNRKKKERKEKNPTTLGPNIPRVLFRPRPLGGDSLPQCGETYDLRAASPTLFVFVLTATCTRRRQDLTFSLTPSQHPCMQPHCTPTSSKPTPLHPIAISVLATISLSRARYWSSSRQPLRIERPPTSTNPFH